MPNPIHPSSSFDQTRNYQAVLLIGGRRIGNGIFTSDARFCNNCSVFVATEDIITHTTIPLNTVCTPADLDNFLGTRDWTISLTTGHCFGADNNRSSFIIVDC